MSYLKFKEYKVTPTKSFEIIRNCAGCCHKSIFVNSDCFRINANGNSIDVWLIYQCKKCKHTFNLPIYERVKPKSIKQEEYLKLLANDLDLVFKYGTDTQLLKQNKIDISWSEMTYKITAEQLSASDDITDIIINNPTGIKIRTEKVLSEIIGVSKQVILKMIAENKIYFKNKILSKRTEIKIDIDK